MPGGRAPGTPRKKALIGYRKEDGAFQAILGNSVSARRADWESLRLAKGAGDRTGWATWATGKILNPT